MKALTQFITLLLLFAGVQVWIYFTDAEIGPKRAVAVALLASVAVAAALFTPALSDTIDWIRKPSTKVRRVLAVSLGVLGIAYLAETAASQQRLRPVIHDEYCYIIQAQMYAKGRLWMPRHELGEFFDSFHIVTDRVYASKYTPGTALFAAPVIALGMPYWVTPLVLSGACIALLYLLLTEWIDGLAGLLGAMMLPALTAFRRTSVELLSQTPMLFLALLAMLAFIYWRRSKKTGWLIVMSAAVGWAAVTRPLDAVALAVPLLIAVLFEMRMMGGRARLRTVAVGLAAVAPFLILQLVVNNGITGSLTKLPWTEYAKKHDPFDRFLVGARPTPVTASLPQKVDFSNEFTIVQYTTQRSLSLPNRLIEHRLEPALVAGIAHPLLYVFLPLGVVASFTRLRWIALLFMAMFLGFYSLYAFFFTHYAVVVIPGVILLVLAGLDHLANVFPPLRAIIAAGILALVAMSYPQLEKNPPSDNWEHAVLLREYDRRLAEIRDPAIVLIRYVSGKTSPHAEPVYNADVAWPDDATVIRVHDLGERNAKLFKYYAGKLPTRDVYLYDRSKDGREDALRYLGKVKDLAQTP